MSLSLLHTVQVPNHIRKEEQNQKRRETNQANIQRLAAPVEVVDDLHDLSQESDVDAAGEDDSDENLNAQSELDFGPAHEDDTALPPPLFIGSPSTPPLHAAPSVHGDADKVDHSKLQSMFGLDPEEAEMGRMILKARFSRS
jgi:hypothetical protein